MKKVKIILSLAILTICQHVSGQIMSASPYCQPVFDNNYNMFNNIKIKGSTLSFGAMGTWIDTNSYRYYNTISFPNFIKGDTASFQLNVYSVDDVEPAYFALWIDLNGNNMFDSSELLMQNSNTTMALLPATGAPVSPINKVITIPLSASSGVVRVRFMRGINDSDIYGPYNSAFSLHPCPVSTGSHATYGCTYDFNINIVNGTTTDIGKTELLSDAVAVFPNPANDFITISTDMKDATVSITDISGKAINNFAINGNKVDVSLIPAGYYFMRVVANGKTLFSPLYIQR